jgi:sec-independent protein translocase protein TatC
MSQRDESLMAFITHWREGKMRIRYCIFSFFLTFCVCFYFGDCFLYIFAQPLAQVHSLASNGFIYTEITEVFETYLNLAFYVTGVLVAPLCGHHYYHFTKPGLYGYEVKRLRIILFTSFSLFLLAHLWAYFCFLPMLFSFFLNFQGIFSDLVFSGRILLFIEFVVGVCWQMGLCFQFPLFFFLLLYSGSLSLEGVASPFGRKLFFVVALAAAALLTPPDVLSQLLVVSWIQFFFEVTLYLVLIADRLRKEVKVEREEEVFEKKSKENKINR